jgi:UDP-N-acetylmuramate dehydrogenase
VPTGDLDLQQNVKLAPYTTLGIGGPARFFAEAHTPAHIEQAVAWARSRALPLFILGGGSNLLVRDAGFDGLVLKVTIPGITPCQDGLPGCLDVGAGEPWDSFVDVAIAQNLAGIECLAGIPGLVGGTPVQNVGAYGQEVAETIRSVHAFDRKTSDWVDLDHVACRFRYRESLFNTDQPGRFIVTQVHFQLRPGGAPTFKYADLQKRFSSDQTPTLAEVASAVRDIRRAKGMLLVEGDPDCRSAGSFFKNPIVNLDTLTRIQATMPGTEVPHWNTTPGCVKIPAAWLLEKAGFVKGYGSGPARISTRHTLALTNRGNATCTDLERLQTEIVEGVETKFGVTLDREPVLLG